MSELWAIGEQKKIDDCYKRRDKTVYPDGGKCTCDERVYASHECPYQEFLEENSDFVCCCCPHCYQECLWDI